VTPLVFGGLTLRLLIIPHGFALFPGIAVYDLSLLFGGFAGFDSILSDAAVFALGGGGECPGEE